MLWFSGGASASSGAVVRRHNSPPTLRPRQLRLRACRSFLRPELRDARDQLDRDGLGKREADRALVNLVRRKLVLERRDDVTGGAIDRVVLLPPSERKHWSRGQFVPGHLVTDYFLGARHG